MQGNNRAKLHIFFHLTTLKRNYYVFWRIKTLFHQIFRRHRTPLRKKREPTPQIAGRFSNYNFNTQKLYNKRDFKACDARETAVCWAQMRISSASVTPKSPC